MSTNIDLAQVASIPFVDVTNLQGRFLGSLFFYDGERWRTWTPLTDGTLIELKIVSLAEGYYFAKAPESPNDIWFRSIDYIAQHAAFPELKHAVIGIMDDISNLSASLSKLRLLHNARDTIGFGVEKMAATEVEYILSVCRSTFDLLQEVIAKLWESVQLLDTTTKKRQLKKSFSDMVMVSNEPATIEHLMQRYGLPQQLAEFYVGNAPFFIDLWKIRNKIVHNGSQVQTIFSGESGFFVSGHLRHFPALRIWRDDERTLNNLVPLLPAMGAIIFHTLSALEHWVFAFTTNIDSLPPAVPGMQLFMRGHFNEFFVEVLREVEARMPQENSQSKQDDSTKIDA